MNFIYETIKSNTNKLQLQIKQMKPDSVLKTYNFYLVSERIYDCKI